MSFVAISLPLHKSEYWTGRRILGWAMLLCAISLGLHAAALVHPVVLWDDFQILRLSWTWNDASSNLWYPSNEHSMPLGRITTWLLVCLAGRLSHVAVLFALQGVLALLWALVLIYRFVSREVGHPFAGLLAMGLYGISTQYGEAVTWYAASFSVLALDMLLLGLLAAQKWTQTSKLRYLFAAAIWSLLSPGWFALGLLAGPLIVVYLLAALSRTKPQRSGWPLAALLLPLAGTAVALALTVPHNPDQLHVLTHLGSRSNQLSKFDPAVGLQHALRSLVDALLPAAIGQPPSAAPAYMLWGRLLVLVLALAWCWYRAPRRALVLLGIAFMLLPAWMAFSGRAHYDYEQVFAWKRYRLFPYLGLVFVVCGGPMLTLLMRLPQGLGRQALRMLALGAILVQLALQVSLITFPPKEGRPLQVAQFHRVEEVDALCRQQRISADAARQVLPELDFEYCEHREAHGRPINGYDFLRGSDRPVTHSEEEARRLLAP